MKGSKLERFIAQTDMLQSDRVVFPTKEPWFEGLKKELLVFPSGRHEDQVDSVTQFLHWVQTRWGGFVERDPVTGRSLGRPRIQGRPRPQGRRPPKPGVLLVLSRCLIWRRCGRPLVS